MANVKFLSSPNLKNWLGGWLKKSLSIFPPEQDVLKCTAACLVSFGKSDLIKITFVGTGVKGKWWEIQLINLPGIVPGTFFQLPPEIKG